MTLPTCPRCGGYIPDSFTPGAYPGAMSRQEAGVEICSRCGHQEAIRDFENRPPLDRDAWADRAAPVDGVLPLAELHRLVDFIRNRGTAAVIDLMIENDVSPRDGLILLCEVAHEEMSIASQGREGMWSYAGEQPGTVADHLFTAAANGDTATVDALATLITESDDARAVAKAVGTLTNLIADAMEVTEAI